eukprot:1419021-Pyramimonas_sp.AAC.1
MAPLWSGATGSAPGPRCPPRISEESPAASTPALARPRGPLWGSRVEREALRRACPSTGGRLKNTLHLSHKIPL